MLEIRAATQRDASVFGALLAAAWRSGYADILSASALAGATPEFFSRRFRDEQGQAQSFIAREGQEPVGIATLKADVEDAFELSRLYVHPDHWRKGIGRALVSVASEFAQGRGEAQLFAWVADANHAALCFYRTLGFSEGVEVRQVKSQQRTIEMRKLTLALHRQSC